FEALDLKPRPEEAFDLLLCRLHDILVEARDLHLSGFGIDAGLGDFHEFGKRISCRTARDTRLGLAPMNPRNPYGIAGCPLAIQIVSETTTESGQGTSARCLRPAPKCGLPISSSSSQRNRML